MGFEDKIKKDYLEDWKETVIEKIQENDDIVKIIEHVLHIARIIDYPNLKIPEYMSMMNEMGKELTSQIKDTRSMRPTHIIEKLNEFFFDNKKFQPNISDYYNPVNNYLNIVLEKRTGIPITLSLIYIHLASYMDFKLHPVNFPSHFLVKYILDQDSDESIVIDPFNKGRIMDDYVLQDLLNKAYPRSTISLSNDLLKKTNSLQITIRVLNNLKNGYTEVDDLNKIMKINEMILSLDSTSPEALRDKGIILYRNKKYEQALGILYKYIDLNPEANDIDRILELVKQIRKIIRK
ncbi:MAG TPA: transglutaminase-like domain-containing protein [Candidatus Nitrosocosmicus sp.]|nr:transglutaminase-like domain-containing protein [Candidatus Nitrosocosmicus sp.]